MKKYSLSILAFALLTGSAMAASSPSAINPLGTQGTSPDKVAMDASLGKGACAADVQQYCSDITPGVGRVAACLKSHSDRVSNDCQVQMKTAANEFRMMRKDCHADVAKFCEGNEVGKGKILSCLKSHQDDLSTACKSDTQNFLSTT